jgi:DNA-binding NarL/FixJ family response regulator
MSIRLLLVDDEDLVRFGLRTILDLTDDIDVIGEASDGAQAVSAARALRPEVVLMDIRMPRVDGLAATRQILDQPDPPKVVILTTFHLDEYVYSALQAGASGSCSRTPHHARSSPPSAPSPPAPRCSPPP